MHLLLKEKEHKNKYDGKHVRTVNGKPSGSFYIAYLNQHVQQTPSPDYIDTYREQNSSHPPDYQHIDGEQNSSLTSINNFSNFSESSKKQEPVICLSWDFCRQSRASSITWWCRNRVMASQSTSSSLFCSMNFFNFSSICAVA